MLGIWTTLTACFHYSSFQKELTCLQGRDCVCNLEGGNLGTKSRHLQTSDLSILCSYTSTLLICITSLSNCHARSGPCHQAGVFKGREVTGPHPHYSTIKHSGHIDTTWVGIPEDSLPGRLPPSLQGKLASKQHSEGYLHSLDSRQHRYDCRQFTGIAWKCSLPRTWDSLLCHLCCRKDSMNPKGS